MKSYETESRQTPDRETTRVEETAVATSSQVEEQAVAEAEVIDAPPYAEYNKQALDVPEKRTTQSIAHLRFTRPTREQLLHWLPFFAVVLLGAILRFWGLGEKPLHHDESLHAYFSLQLMHNMENWLGCFNPNSSCYHYDPLLHGPFQFHAIALVYKISQLLGVYDHGVNTTTVRIAAATLGTVIVALPFFLQDYLGRSGAWLACFLLAISPSMVYFSRFAREDIYMACFTLLLVVAIARYAHTRRMRWLVTAAAAFSLSYATKEATFLTIAVFGSFFGALVAWEIGATIPFGKRREGEARLAHKVLPRTGTNTGDIRGPQGTHKGCPYNGTDRPVMRVRTIAGTSLVDALRTLISLVLRTWAPVTLLLYFVIIAPIAKLFFGWMKDLSIYITDPRNTNAANVFVDSLKDRTVMLVPWISVVLGIYITSILLREASGKLYTTGRHGLASRVEPKKQPLLDILVTMPWMHWLFALLCGWTIFLVLFSVLFTNIRGGIGDGIWQGLYYWVQQQQVARGGQPWYYYFLLIPLYEQIGLVFGIVGLVRCLIRPTRFRLFLVYWFIGNVAIYSWAAEKMPWLVIHMTMPMMLLAALALEPALATVANYVKSRSVRATAVEMRELPESPVTTRQPRPTTGAVIGAACSLVLAFLLLLPTLQNMYHVTYVEPADGPHEMLIYVQTTTDVNIVMSKLDALDQKLYGGRHQLSIGVTDDGTWPFIWYLRDYSNVCYQYPTGCTSNVQAIVTGGERLYTAENQYSSNYAYHQYHMRSWWDEGYKPPPCIPTAKETCVGQPTWGGVGLWPWLSYGANPPAHAQFDLRRAVNNVWQWWWYRKAIGNTDGAYDMGLFIRKDLGVAP